MQVQRLLTRSGLTLQTCKTALAAALAWMLATTCTPSHYPYFAPLAAMLTVQVTVADSLRMALQRLGGIIIGVIISIFVGHWLSIGASSIFFITLIGMSVTTALHTSPLVTSQVAISSLLVLAISKGPGYAAARITETVIGSIVAITVNAVLIPPNVAPSVEKRIWELYGVAAVTLYKLSSLLYEHAITQQAGRHEVMLLASQTEKGLEAVKIAAQSLKYSPFPQKQQKRVAQLTKRMEHLEHITIQIKGIRKGLIDLHATPLSTQDTRHLQQAITATGACLSKLSQQMLPTPFLGEEVEAARLLQATCLSSMKNQPSLSALREVAGILTDLHRILQEIEGET